MASTSEQQAPSNPSSEGGLGFDFPMIRLPNVMMQRMGSSRGIGILSEGALSPYQMMQEGTYAAASASTLPYSMDPASHKNLTFFTKHLQAPCFPPKAPRIQPGEFETETPISNDVLMGRGSRINNHEGNIQFREHVGRYKVQYLNKNTKKMQKAHMCADIVEWVRGLSPPGRFMQKSTQTGNWVEIGDERARKKAGQALREDASSIRKDLHPGEGGVGGSGVSNLSSVASSSLGGNGQSSNSPNSFYTTTSSVTTVPTSNRNTVHDSNMSELPVFYSNASQLQQSQVQPQLQPQQLQSTGSYLIRNRNVTSSDNSSHALDISHRSTDAIADGKVDSSVHNVNDEISHIEMDIQRMNEQLHQQQLYLKQQQEHALLAEHAYILLQKRQHRQEDRTDINMNGNPSRAHAKDVLEDEQTLNSTTVASNRTPPPISEVSLSQHPPGEMKLNPPQLAHYTSEDLSDILRHSVMSWNNGDVTNSMVRRTSVVSNSMHLSINIHRSGQLRKSEMNFDMQDLARSVTSLTEGYDPDWFHVTGSMNMSFIGSEDDVLGVDLDEED
jgi:hypothetical protein